MCILLREHAVGNTDKDTINLDRVSRILADDWGFYHTVSTNLKKLHEYAGECPGLSGDDRKTIREKITTISDAIEKEPKTLKWKMRARVGEKKRWYGLPEEVSS
jgi:hypothetical protein